MSTQIQEFTSSGTFNVPSNVSLVYVTGTAGGAGGDPWPSGAGGSGCFAFRMPVPVTPGGTLAITVGDKGIRANGGSPGTGTAGGNTVVGWMILGGGHPPRGDLLTSRGGQGGGSTGGCMFANGNSGFALTNEDGLYAGFVYNGPAVCTINGTTPNCYGGGGGGIWGGSSGGGAGGAGKLDGNLGAASVNGHDGGDSGGPYTSGCACGAGGGSSPWGRGGMGGNAAGTFIGADASPTAYGAGGGGGTCNNLDTNAGHGGDGAPGVVWVEY